MGIWKINIERKHCVIAYAMPTHSVHSPIFFQGIPEPPSEVAWIARYFFCLAANDKKETIMGKVQILAILSMDGCLSELNPKKRLFRSPEDYGMEEIRGKALYRLTPFRYCKTSGRKRTTPAICWKRMQRQWDMPTG